MPNGNLSTPMDILKAALRKEEAAHRFYANLQASSHSAPVRELLTQLREEEHRHIQLIERKIVELNLG